MLHKRRGAFCKVRLVFFVQNAIGSVCVGGVDASPGGFKGYASAHGHDKYSAAR